MRFSKQKNANERGERSYDHHSSNPHSFGNRNVNKHINIHGHLVRSLHSGSTTRPSGSIESQWTRSRSALEEGSHREWESKRQACVKAMTRLKDRLRASNEVEDDFVLVDADPSIPDSTVSVHYSLAAASPNTRRQLMARQGTYLTGSNKGRIGIKKKSPIAVRFRPRLCRSTSIPLETLNTSHSNDTPTPGSIVGAKVATVLPKSQESMASESDSDFTFVDWFIVAMFVVQSVIWISLGCLFVSVLGS